MQEKVYAVILAAGGGSRMKSRIKKQFMDINGRPMLYYSLRAFEESQVDEIILVTAPEDIDFCRNDIVGKYGFSKVKHIVSGGNERYDSVRRGLEYAKGGIVLIHDGARPAVNIDIISRSIDGALKYGAAVSGVMTKDTVKVVGVDGVIKSTPDRRNVWIAQTPQSFKTDLIKEAYDRMGEDDSITDDAMVIEKYTDADVVMINGDYRNIKVTTPEDVEIVRSYIGNL